MAIIKVENLYKEYMIGGREKGHETLREAIAGIFTAPLRRFRKLSGDVEEEERFWALQDVSFEVKEGEVVGIIGRNGAGKSTLLKILSRITDPTRGRVEILGRVSSLLEVGTGFHPELTGRENIYLNGAILGMSRGEINRKLDEIVAFAEVGKFLDTPVKRYSSGMYVRLAFAVAAHLEPEILIVDEVLAVGDAQFQKKCLGKMGDMAVGGRTVLFVSHNMTAVQQLCGRAVLLDAGRIRKMGQSGETIADYLDDASRSGDGIFDLLQHKNRMKGTFPVIQRLVTCSGNGKQTSSFEPFDSLVAELTIEPTAPIKEPRIALAIEDNLGRRITTVASFFQERQISGISRRSVVRVTLPVLQLAAGRYLISLSIGDTYAGHMDALENVAWFDVVWRNSYGNGEEYRPVYGPVLFPSQWEVVDC